MRRRKGSPKKVRRAMAGSSSAPICLSEDFKYDPPTLEERMTKHAVKSKDGNGSRFMLI
jgi:hypothetical protein